jgi:hypothetical protein
LIDQDPLMASAEEQTVGVVLLAMKDVTSRNVKTKVGSSSVWRKLPDRVLNTVDAKAVVYPFVFGGVAARLYTGNPGAW